MDGNGRWAEERGRARAEGHRAGATAVERTVEAAPPLGITDLTLYAFSSDNWKRPASEVNVLMELFHDYLLREAMRCRRNGIALRVIGRRDRLSPALLQAIETAERQTRRGTRMILRIAVDYSSRWSLAAAAGSDDLRRALAAANHDASPMPDVDLLIRTGREKRLSDFLLWESSYAEIHFTDTLWPDFNGGELAAAVAWFRTRSRRFGNVSSSEFLGGDGAEEPRNPRNRGTKGRSAMSANPNRKLRYPAIVEILILAVITFVLILGLAMIWAITGERAQRATSVRADIASSWGASQTIGGPILIVPYYTVRGEHPTIAHAVFLPDRLQIRGTLAPETRHRGIYDTVVYRADLHLEGSFARPDFSAWDVAPNDILWNQATLALGVTDLRGMRGATLQWNGTSIQFSGGTPDTRLWPSGLTAVAPVDLRGGPYAFRADLQVNGSEAIAFLPVGGQTVADVSAPWNAPSFGGAFLPESRTITPSQFAARWTISSLARSYPQRWRDIGDDNNSALSALNGSAFRVALFSPVGGYQQTERSIKYGALFIVLTFVTFFLYELLSPVTLHPVQYFLVGGALCVFYLLLLSISEQASFGAAYLIASVATVLLICAYATALLRSRLRVVGLAGVLALLYGYLYVLLQLEDWALMMGSIGLFLILALVMYATRNIDWGSAHVAAAAPSTE